MTTIHDHVYITTDELWPPSLSMSHAQNAAAETISPDTTTEVHGALGVDTMNTAHAHPQGGIFMTVDQVLEQLQSELTGPFLNNTLIGSPPMAFNSPNSLNTPSMPIWKKTKSSLNSKTTTDKSVVHKQGTLTPTGQVKANITTVEAHKKRSPYLKKIYMTATDPWSL